MSIVSIVAFISNVLVASAAIPNPFPMNFEQLKVAQAPFKDRNRSEPSSALVTVRTHGGVDVNSQHYSIKPRVSLG